MIMNTLERWYDSAADVSPKILICPSGFKESLDQNIAADCIEAGILKARPNAVISKVPLVDGGEGFTKALVATTNGTLRRLVVTGPTGQPVQSYFGFLGGERHQTAVIEMAAAAGLRLVPIDQRDPTVTTTFGVGQLIKAALEAGARHILIGCGDSGTCDGGVGMAQALGARFVDEDGAEIDAASGSRTLSKLSSVDLSSLHPLLKTVTIDVACNWHNVLCGPKGVARIFGPQKGASPKDIESMSQAMDRCAYVIKSASGIDVGQMPGSGASGGLGAGLLLVGAQLHPRFDIIMKFLSIDDLLDDCDLVFTAEGAIDFQTPNGKIPSEVARQAKLRGLPVIALAGTVGSGAEGNYGAGIDAFVSMLQRPMSLEEAIDDAERLLTDSAESAMRMVAVGWTLGQQISRRSSRASNELTVRDEILGFEPPTTKAVVS